jgi:segregation and condensation protein B
MELQHQIQAILFYQAEPMSVGRLTKLLKKSEEEVHTALMALRETLTQTGLALVENGNEVMLATSPAASSLIEAITKEELSKDLSKAALETLAIVLYKGPITRAEIDYIRGVNSNFILRNLQVRGLVEKVDNPQDQRSYLYKATFALLEHMGVTRITDLPEYNMTTETLGAFLSAKEVEVPKPEAKETPEAPIEQTEEREDATGLEEENTDESTIDDTELDDTLNTIEESFHEIETDIIEENEAGGAYDDTQLQEHREGNEQHI